MQLDSARELKAHLVSTWLSQRPDISRAARRERGLGFLQVPVPGLALGISRSADREHQLALRLQLREPQTDALVEQTRIAARGEIDLRYVGRITKLSPPWYRTRQRPILIGVSVGHPTTTAGTVACFIKRKDSSQPKLLSNNHVLADEDRADIGDPIVQPGPADGGRQSSDAIGSLSVAIPLRRSGVNYVDAAVADLQSDVPYDPATLTDTGTLTGIVPDDFLPIEVEKIGRTTGHTTGRVTAFELDGLRIDFETGQLTFDNQIEIEGTRTQPFSEGGDSGSLIIDAERRAVGLLFAGSDTGGANDMGVTYANPIGTVLNSLTASLVT